MLIKVVLSAAIICALCTCNEKETEQYNVLFITIDDLRPELGCYGTDAVTPSIDAVAQAGVLYTNAYCQFSWCSPSRASMLTGLRPDKTGVFDLKTHFRKKLPDTKTLPQYFKDNGYHTAAFGKIYHNEIFLQDSSSWSEPNWFPPFEEPLYVYASEENKRIVEARKKPFSYPTESASVEDEAYPDGMITAEAIKKMNELQDQDFFIAVGFYKPHLPYNAPKKYFDLYDPSAFDVPESEFPNAAPPFALRARSEEMSYVGVNEKPYSDSLKTTLTHGYYACVSYVDAQIGKLVDELERLNLRKKTIIVIWGDHGYKLGEYGHWSKHSNFDVDTRVPLVISSPSVEKRVEKNIVESIDIYPTLCELTGLPVPIGLDGKNISGKDSPIEKDFAISQIVRDSLIGYSIRWSDLRYTRWISLPGKQVHAEELYDHSIDPKETDNKAAHEMYRASKAALSQKLDVIIKL